MAKKRKTKGPAKRARKVSPRRSRAPKKHAQERSRSILGLVPIKYDELRQKVIAALKDAGCDWLQDVELASQLRIPNWKICHVVGARNDKEGLSVLTHPAVVDLQKQYALLPASSGK